MKRFFALLKLPTTKDIIINASGNYLSVFFTAAYALILVRILDPAQYGVLAVLFAIAYLLANILDFGVTASIFSYLPPMLVDKEESVKFIKANFIFQTILALLFLVIFFIFIDPIDKYILKLNVPIRYYFWTLLSVPLFIWQNFVLNVLFAAKKFLYGNILNNIAFFLKIVLLFVLIYFKQVTIEYIIITSGIIGQLVFFIVLIHQKKPYFYRFLKAPISRSYIRLRYTLTFFVASQLFNLSTRIDLFMLAFFLTKTEVGYYGLSQKVILTVISAVNSVTQVLSPQFASVKTRSEITNLVKKSFVYILLPTAVFVVMIILPTPIYTLVFTEKYLKATLIIRLLSISFIMFGLTVIPVLFFLYTIKKPLHLFYINIIFLSIITTSCFLLIPIYGVFGPPIGFMIGYIAVSFYCFFAFKHEINKL